MTHSRWAVAAVVGISLLIYAGDGRAHPEVDCMAAPYTAWSLVRHGSLDVSMYEPMRRYLGASVREVPDGAWVSMRSPGAAVTAIPVVAPFALFRSAPFTPETMDQLGKLAAALSVAGAAGLFFATCRRLVPAASWPATVLFAVGSSLCSVASQALWMHGPATFWLCVALYLLAARRAERFPGDFLAGLAFGMAILARPTTVFFGAATGVSFLLQRRWRAAGGLLVGALGPVLAYLWVNEQQFGHALLGGYANDSWETPPPLWLGLGGLLIAPSRGLLVYSPALLLVPLGIRMACQKANLTSSARGLIVAWLLAASVTILFFARWHDWRGGWCYGPRFLCETMPVFCLLFALGYDGLRGSWSRPVAHGLVALSVGVHALGLFGYGKGYVDWHERHSTADQGRCLFSVRDTQIEAHLRYVWREARVNVQKKLNFEPKEQPHASTTHYPPDLHRGGLGPGPDRGVR